MLARQSTSADDMTVAFESALQGFNLFSNLISAMIKQYVLNLGLY